MWGVSAVATGRSATRWHQRLSKPMMMVLARRQESLLAPHRRRRTKSHPRRAMQRSQVAVYTALTRLRPNSALVHLAARFICPRTFMISGRADGTVWDGQGRCCEALSDAATGPLRPMGRCGAVWDGFQRYTPAKQEAGRLGKMILR